jgi:glycine hydroxymethyltransferase
LDHEGRVLDDILLYRLEDNRYWMVVNAANAAKDWAWIEGVRRNEVRIDIERPWSTALGTETVQVRDLSRGSDANARAIVALQGPRSMDILHSLIGPQAPVRESLLEMKRTEILHGQFAGFDLWVARTGYTGEPMGYELFVHPAAAPALWRALLEAGEAYGLRPVGLAARDSLRIEAGLPLYGHELAGPMELNPADAGFGPYVKLYKPFFVGKPAYMAHEEQRDARLIRFRFTEENARMPRQGDVVVNRKGRVVGAVTSCSIDSEGWLTGLAYVQNRHASRGMRLGIFQVDARRWSSTPLTKLKTGDQVLLHDDIVVIRRFLDKKA